MVKLESYDRLSNLFLVQGSYLIHVKDKLIIKDYVKAPEPVP